MGYLWSFPEIKYAQNSVTDVLIELGSFKPDKGGKLKIDLNEPITASHIFIYSNNEVSDITVVEYDGVSLLNIYPKCFDYKLRENHYLDTVTVYTQKAGFSHYSLYTSLNGRDFELAAVKNDCKPCGENGDKNVYFIDGYSLFPDVARHDCTVDGCHPNDLGMYFMAERIGGVIASIM